MSDFEATLNISEIEALSPEERIRSKVEKNIRNWIQTDFSEEQRDLALTKPNRRDRQWYMRNIKSSTSLTRALWTLKEGSSAQRLSDLDQKLKADLFDSPRAVTSVAGRDHRNEISSQIVGSISTLTCMDLLKGSRRDLRSKLMLTDVLVPAEVDAEYATDLSFSFGDTNPNYSDAEILRIVQLKVAKRGEIAIFALDKEKRENDPSGRLDDRSLRRIHSYADVLEGENSKLLDVRPYVMTVPVYNDQQIDNVFGIITNNPIRRDKVLSEFGLLAEKVGFFPKGVSHGQ